MSASSPLSEFVGRHVGPRADDVEQMLGLIDQPTLDALCDAAVPGAIRQTDVLGIVVAQLPNKWDMRARDDHGVAQYGWFRGKKGHSLIVPIHLAHIRIVPLHNCAKRATGFSSHSRVLPCVAHVVR